MVSIPLFSILAALNWPDCSHAHREHLHLDPCLLGALLIQDPDESSPQVPYTAVVYISPR